jgi:hypothetical protein
MKRIFVPVSALVFLALPCLFGQSPEEVTKEEMLATPQWQEKYDQTAPSQEMLDIIKTRLEGVKVDVVLGLWCPDSRNNVPQFLKIADALGTSLPVHYFDVPRKPNSDVKYYYEEWKVERVPTFIFYRDGKEIGRIIENPKIGMLEDILDLIMAEKTP